MNQAASNTIAVLFNLNRHIDISALQGTRAELSSLIIRSDSENEET
jgi:hypothetical protein